MIVRMVNAIARTIPTVNTNLAGLGFGFGATYPSWRPIDVAMADFRGPNRRHVRTTSHSHPWHSVTVCCSCCLRGEQHEQSVTAAAAHRTRYGAALSRVFVRDLGLHAPA